MYNFFKKLGLSFFGEGAAAGDGGDGASTSAVSPEVAEQGSRTLEDLGVPKEKAEKYRQRKGITQTVKAEQTVPDTSEEVPSEPTKTLKDALKENSSWNQEAQEMITNRVKNLNARLADVEPILQMLGENYGFDTTDLSKLDLKALADKVSDDNKYYEDKALEMGTDVETAKRILKREKEAARAEKEAQETLQANMLREHYVSLQNQAAELKKTIPGFDLETELKNNQFMRMTSPDGGMSVEDAFYALHHREIMKYKQAETARNVSQALSNSIQSGRAMPTENGAVTRASSPVSNKMYSAMNAQERAEWLKQVKAGKKF